MPEIMSFVMGHGMTSLSLCIWRNFAIPALTSSSVCADMPEMYLEMYPDGHKAQTLPKGTPLYAGKYVG